MMYFSTSAGSSREFWAAGFKYRYFLDSTNLIFVPEYMFEENKIREHQKALYAGGEAGASGGESFRNWKKNSMCMILSVKMCTMIMKKPYSHEIIGPLGHGVGVCEGCKVSERYCAIRRCVVYDRDLQETIRKKESNTAIRGISSELAGSIIIWM